MATKWEGRNHTSCTCAPAREAGEVEGRGGEAAIVGRRDHQMWRWGPPDVDPTLGAEETNDGGAGRSGRAMAAA